MVLVCVGVSVRVWCGMLCVCMCGVVGLFVFGGVCECCVCVVCSFVVCVLCVWCVWGGCVCVG